MAKPLPVGAALFLLMAWAFATGAGAADGGWISMFWPVVGMFWSDATCGKKIAPAAAWTYNWPCNGAEPRRAVVQLCRPGRNDPATMLAKQRQRARSSLAAA